MEKHRITLTVITQKGDGSKVTKLELSPHRLDRGTELEERIVSELVRSIILSSYGCNYITMYSGSLNSFLAAGCKKVLVRS